MSRPEAASTGLAVTGWPFAIVAPALGDVSEKAAGPAVSGVTVKVSEAGSARRRKETFRDLDIIATATDPETLIDYFTKLKWVIEVVAKGPTKATVLSNEGLRFDLRVVPPESYGNLLQHFTGSKDHNVALRERAVSIGGGRVAGIAVSHRAAATAVLEAVRRQGEVAAPRAQGGVSIAWVGQSQFGHRGLVRDR